jgi:hypothetical protein
VFIFYLNLGRTLTEENLNQWLSAYSAVAEPTKRSALF